MKWRGLFLKAFSEKSGAVVEFVILLALAGVVTYLTFSTYGDKMQANNTESTTQVRSGLGVGQAVRPNPIAVTPPRPLSLQKPVIFTNATPPYTSATAFQFMAATAGGTGFYTYAWTGYNGGSANGAYGSPQNFAPGAHTVSVTVSDGATTATSEPYTFEIGTNPDAGAIKTTDAGGAAVTPYVYEDFYLSIEPAGGAGGPYTCAWAWNGNPVGANNDCVSKLIFHYDQPTTLTVFLRVCDRTNACTSYNRTINVSWSPIESVAVAGDPVAAAAGQPTIRTGDNVRFQVSNVVRGSRFYTLTWSNYAQGSLNIKEWGSYINAFTNATAQAVNQTIVAHVCDIKTNACVDGSYLLRVLPNPPSAPTNLSAAAGNAQAALSWTASPNTTGYKIYKNGTLLTTIQGTSYTASGLTNFQTYSFTVAATNDGGDSSQSNAVSATPQAPPATAPPNLSARPNGGGSVTVNWTSVPNASFYNVYRDGVKIATVNAPATSYTATGLNDTTRYTFAVDSGNNGGTGPQAAGVSAYPQAIPAAPDVPSAAAGDKQVTLSWADVPNASSYNIYQGGAKIASGVTGTSYTAAGLTNGAAYSFTVSATGLSGEGQQSPSVTATPRVLTPAPANFVASSNTPYGTALSSNTGSIYSSWNPVAGALSYNFYKDGVLVANLQNWQTYYNYYQTLNVGTTYKFEVAAVTAAGESLKAAQILSPQRIPQAPTPGYWALSGFMVGYCNSGARLYANVNIYRDGYYIGSDSSNACTWWGNYDYYSHTYSVTIDGSPMSPPSAPFKYCPYNIFVGGRPPC